MPPGPPRIAITVMRDNPGPKRLWAAVAHCLHCRAPIYEPYDPARFDRYLSPLKTWDGTVASCNHPHIEGVG